MKREKISEILDGIDERYIAEAAEVKKARRFPVLKAGVAAACIIFAVAVTAVLIPVMNRSKDDVTDAPASADVHTVATEPTDESNPSENTENLSPVRPYKENASSASELAYLWLWEDMTPTEKYVSFSYEGKEYTTRAAAISEDKLGGKLGTAEFRGYDICNDITYTESFDIFAIRSVSPENLLAAHIEEEFVVFINLGQAAPATLGELMDAYALPSSLSFEKFSLNESYKPKENYGIADGSGIWDILEGCADAPLCPEDVPDFTDNEYISFIATSEALGIYKKVFTVTDNGYVDTNICEYGYTYYIGTDAAKEIFNICLKEGIKTEAEPYMYYIYGYVTEINDGYFLVDDSKVCKDPSDGLVFKVKTDDIRIERYVKHGIVREGAFIELSFKGEFTEDYVIEDVWSISEAHFYGGDIVTLE